MSYTESTNVISITNALPTSSAEGMMQSEYFDFSVTSNLELNENDPVTPVYYEITLEPLGVDEGYNALTDNQIKVYLEDVTNGTSVIVEPTLVSSAEVSENNTSYKILYSTSHNHSYGVNSITTKYRLRAWIDYSVDASTWSETNLYEYKFRVNVNSNADYVGYIPPSPEYCFTYETEGATAKITDYNCYEGNTYGYETITDVVIPETFNGYTVTTISESAFYSNNLTSVILPETLTTIMDGDHTRRYGAFSGNNLTSIEIPDSVITIGNAAFIDSNLMSVTLGNSVETIGISAFENNNLTSVEIPDSVTTIDERAFSSNNLTSATLGNSVTTIGFNAFEYNNLTSVTIPDSVTRIRSEAFAYNNLSYVVIGENSNLIETTGIGQDAFSSSTLTTTNFGNTYVDNPNLTTIYNNSGKTFKWYYITQGIQNSTSSTYNFITGTVPSYTSGITIYNEVLVTTGYPE